MDTERLERLAVLMGAMAAGDTTAIFSLYREFRGQLAAFMRRELARLGADHLEPEELDGLVMDACFALWECGGAWKADGGALPWTWAGRRLAGVASAWVGQYTDELHDERVEIEADIGSAWNLDDAEDEVDVLARLARRHDVCALLLEALAQVATQRDQSIVLELRCQAAAGDPSPALTVAAHHYLSSDAVRQAASRVRRRLRHLAAQDDRFADLADLPIVA